jgi:hypothetical protein
VIQEFVDKFIQAQPGLFTEKHPDSYEDVVAGVIKAINPHQDYGLPDFERIHVIDDGRYQGTLLFVVAAAGRQPRSYWYVKVDYGSCSGCDTLEAIRGHSSYPVTDDQAKDYQTLALHIVQGMKSMQELGE